MVKDPLDNSQSSTILSQHGRTRGRPRATEPKETREPIREPARSTSAVAHGRSRKRKGNVDQFYVADSIIPDGWDYQWCRKSIYNQPDPAHIVGLMENGWTPVPSERHEGLFMPPGHRGEIERGGLVLMERPKELTAEAREEDARNARSLIQAQKEQLGLSMPAAFNTAHPGVRPQIRTSYEQGPAPGRSPLAID